MDLHYPNGKKYVQMETVKKKATQQKNFSYSNRGMTLESDLNETNVYYLEQGIAVIHKKPTPVQIVQVDYKSRSTAVIREAYFKQPSTTDYNGIYCGRYIDFEAKETQNTTSFPLQNFHKHQIDHMQSIVKQNGISFIILRFARSEEIFLLESHYLFEFWNRMELGGRKSIKKEEVEAFGHKISLGIQPRIDYIYIINQLYQIGEMN